MPEPVQVWYCCQCHYGPQNILIDAACTACQRPRCTTCPVQMAYPKNSFGGDDEGTSPYPGVPTIIFDPTVEDTTFSPSDRGLSLAAAPASQSLALRRPSLAACQDMRHMPQAGAGFQRRHRGGIVTCSPKTYMYICCQCHDGPKVYNHQVVCVICHHVACDDCIPA
ncbi:hypothetical protein VTN77DRAFT_2829 [Rasamsonia byssochlamydoides]|uniref:uncharacterized protein n=1 Tax=Rasamsonia byssochlamydoides TaxID=89139 RepID=UPI003743CCCA